MSGGVPPGAEPTCPTCRAPVGERDAFCTVCGSVLPARAPLAPPSDAAPAEVPWRGWEAIVVWLLATVTGGLIAFLGSLALEGDALIAFTLVVVEGALALWVLGWVRIRHGLGGAALGLRSADAGADVGLGVAAGLGGLALQFVLLSLMQVIARSITGEDVQTPKQISFSHPSAGVVAVTAFAVVVVAPLGEELFFRGFLYQALRRRFGILWGAIVSSVVFGLAHIHPLFYVPIGALGYLLARVFERRRSLVASCVGHGVFNAVGYTVIVLTQFNR